MAPKEHADAMDAFGLLRECAERPCCRRAAEQRDELSPFQLIEFIDLYEARSVAGYPIRLANATRPRKPRQIGHNSK